jgi:hypothetical protein
MTATLTNPTDLWQRVVDSHHEYARAFSAFVVGSSDKINVLRHALRGKDRALALQVVPSLSVAEKQALFEEWVHLARAAHAPFQIAWNIIGSLPREWVLQNIEREVDALLKTDEETDYWMFLQLYARLDDGLMRKLAQRAAAHADVEIRELGQEYLAMPAPAER